MATPLQQALKAVKDDKSLETMEKLTRNSAQAPAEEKFRRLHVQYVRCTVRKRIKGLFLPPRVLSTSRAR
jgi:hypothetical protein